MKTTINLDDDLVREAMAIHRRRSPAAAIGSHPDLQSVPRGRLPPDLATGAQQAIDESPASAASTTARPRHLNLPAMLPLRAPRPSIDLYHALRLMKAQTRESAPKPA